MCAILSKIRLIYSISAQITATRVIQ